MSKQSLRSFRHRDKSTSFALINQTDDDTSETEDNDNEQSIIRASPNMNSNYNATKSKLSMKQHIELYRGNYASITGFTIAVLTVAFATSIICPLTTLIW